MDGDARKALDALEYADERKAKFFLRRYLGEETEYEEVGGHIFAEKGDGFRRCYGRGCELSEGFNMDHLDAPIDYGWENVKRKAEASSCPTPAEGIHFNSQNHGRCPHCFENTATTFDECQQCGKEVENDEWAEGF